VVHAVDAKVLEDYAERLAVVTRDIEAYWVRAGVPAEARADMLAMYSLNKRLFRAERVDRALVDGDALGPGMRVHHVPGHCPGLVCLEVDDVLLTSDHVLARITPHQFPQAIAELAGLGHYFDSLAKIRRLEGISYALGGHEEPILDLRARIDEILAFHDRRLARVLDLCREPRSVHDLATAMFRAQEGYGIILAVDEAGAHVEHLERQGRVVSSRDGDVVRYVARG
jgi:glyoxylase-like metal-dependent hydrolase (beta-lactamase superfamily II)